MEPQTHYRACNLCEAICGLTVTHQHGTVVSIAGDPADPFSRGHICPKAAALDDIRTDPDRVTTPLRRAAGSDAFVPVSWEGALDEASTRLAEIQNAHGRDAVALSLGNPTVHSYGALLGIIVLWKALGTRARFSATACASASSDATSARWKGRTSAPLRMVKSDESAGDAAADMAAASKRRRGRPEHGRALTAGV